jgi:DNA-binding NtrC family response regulator
VLIPPLRERTSEIRGMANAFIAEACERSRRPAPALSETAMARLVAHPWPGNIRELRNVVMRAALLCAGAGIQPEHLMLDEVGAYAESSTPVIAAAPTIRPPPLADVADALGQGGHLEGAVRDFERRRIGEALDRFGGHQGKAAEYLGISRRTLTKKLTDLDMPRPRKGRRDEGA